MHKGILLAIVIIAFLVRFYRLAALPPALNSDEKFNGYLAFSLLTTGKDERDHVFPLAIQTFGNWTLIGAPLITVPFVATLGLTELAVRLPAAAAGVTSTVLIFAIGRHLLGSRRAAYAAALFFALSPWSIFLSRISHETVLGTTSFLTGLWLFLRWREERRNKWLLFSAAALAASLLTHYAYIIFTPLFAAGLVYLAREKIRLNKITLFSAGLFVFVMLAVIRTIFAGSIGQIKDVGILDNRDIIYRRVEHFLADKSHPAGDLLTKFHNKYFGVGYQLAQNYLDVFSPRFLFDKGGETLMHNLGYMGNFYVTDALFILAGLAALARRRQGSLALLGWWVLTIPLTSIFTKDTPSSTRLFPLCAGLLLFAGAGAASLGRSKIPALFVAAAFSFFVFWHLEAYFVHLNIQRGRFFNYGYKEAALVAARYPDTPVVMVGPENFAYISFLFYGQYDPDRFRREVEYYPAKTSGFQFVKNFGRFSFVERMDRRDCREGVLYIDYSGNGDRRNLILLPTGEKLFTYFFKEDLTNGEVR